MTLPQIRGMYTGDRSRKQTLVDYGFRLPSALDNRPLQFAEFWQRVGQVLFTAPRPAPTKASMLTPRCSKSSAPQASSTRRWKCAQPIWNTGRLEASAAASDTHIPIAPREGNQIDDLMQEIARRRSRWPARHRNHPHAEAIGGPGPATSTRRASKRTTCTPKSIRWSASRSCAICALAPTTDRRHQLIARGHRPAGSLP